MALSANEKTKRASIRYCSVLSRFFQGQDARSLPGVSPSWCQLESISRSIHVRDIEHLRCSRLIHPNSGVDTVFLTADGNRKLNHKESQGKSDISLTDGQCFFPPHASYQTYVENHVLKQSEVRISKSAVSLRTEQIISH